MYTCTLQVNEICNLKCNYCYEGEKSNSLMNIKVATKAIDLAISNTKLHEDKKLTINYIGGEPLISFDLVKAITEYTIYQCTLNDIKPIFTITINGTLANKENFDFMISHNFDIKLSLDGNEETNDINRMFINGSGSYKSVLSNLEIFKEYEEKTSKKIEVSMVIAKNNFRRYYQNLKHIIDLGFSRIDSAINIYEEWTLDDIKELEDVLRKSFYYIRDIIKQGKDVRWYFYEKIYQSFTSICSGKCTAGIISIYVNTDGLIYPCMVDESIKPIGNVEMGLDFKLIREVYVPELKVDRECINCSLVDCCPSRKCHALNMIINNDMSKPIDILCSINKIFARLLEEEGVVKCLV